MVLIVAEFGRKLRTTSLNETPAARAIATMDSLSPAGILVPRYALFIFVSDIKVECSIQKTGGA